MHKADFHSSVRVAKVLSLPAGLIRKWGEHFVRDQGLRMLENEGGGYCGYYALGQVENALLGRKKVSPHTVRERLHELARSYTLGDLPRRKAYRELAPHWLQDFELSWYLNWLQVNWVLLHFYRGTKGQHEYSAEVQGDPSRSQWVFLVNKGRNHWVVLTKSQKPKGERELVFDPVFTTAETKRMVLALGAEWTNEDSRVWIEPTVDPNDYDWIEKPLSKVAKKKTTASRRASEPDADSDSDATFADDPYR